MLERNPKMRKRSKQNPGYAHQGLDNDRLFKASCGHVPGPDCRGCDTADEIHYGIIASGNMLVKDAATRDRMLLTDRWQRYASATAAAYAKELLEYVPAAEVQETKRALEVLQSG
ncbi:hypothetical protein QBC38DRAFT_540367 [Podospora fimiseda]|uniref:Uncharacterized protein n=1 Tax=Podospora fimiseda TaxID=252190 RepID=A0AAN7BCP3_9PEZI|nr:hypothetical protein QBC38DRAFT_540367 [Podospora fimiseda]